MLETASRPHPRLAIPDQRWHIHPSHSDHAAHLAADLGISPLLAQVLLNRGIATPAAAKPFLDPETLVLDSPLEDFTDLPIALELLINAINQRQSIAICGDYDADGMTSTALLIRALRCLGARVDYAIPSRMQEGYGINERIVEDFYEEGVSIILTVDNGIAAHKPIARARELGLSVIITDHHDLPPELPKANAILNPKLIAATSPYRGMAGVGVAYILAVCLAQSFSKGRELGDSLLELFTLGTIADLAPLTGVNRRWVKRGLQLLPKSKLAGVQALIQVAGLSGEKNLKPEAIGFRLGPRINAVGRIGDPQVVIELLTTDEPGVALERAMQCEQINKTRQQLCEEIEQSAIAAYEDGTLDAQFDRVLLLVQAGWHHGVIGIVASRLVERYGVPVFISTYEDEAHSHIRGSARSIPEFNIFDALEYCKDLLLKHGGHRAAGGFSLAADQLESLRSRLRDFAHQCLEPQHLKPLITVDAQADLTDLDFALCDELDVLHPCGMDNPDPVFWTPNVRIVEQKLIGKGHLKLTVSQEMLTADQVKSVKRIQAIAWRWGEYYPLPQQVDIAYRLKTNEWNGEVSVQLEIIGIRMPTAPLEQAVEFTYNQRPYVCTLLQRETTQELRIRNFKGEVLAVQKGQKIGQLGKLNQTPQTVDVCQPPYFQLIKAAVQALNPLPSKVAE